VVWAYLLFAFAAGAVLPFQAGANAELADWLNSPARAAFVSFLTGTLPLAVAAALVFKPLPSLGPARRGAVVGMGRGALGAFYVAASIVSAPKLGAATLIGLVVAWSGARLAPRRPLRLGFEPKHVTAGRVAGMAMTGAGVALVRIF